MESINMTFEQLFQVSGQYLLAHIWYFVAVLVAVIITRGAIKV